MTALARPAVKVCGITRQSDMDLCRELGAAFTGFIFAPRSPRRITPEQAADLDSRLGHKAPRPLRVGVVAGQSLQEVRAIMQTARLDLVQLHGGEDPDFCRALGPERVIKTLWPHKLLEESGEPGEAGDRLPDLLDRACAPFVGACAYFLLDAGSGGGGSGHTLPWHKLALFRPPAPWLLAGGIGPDNAALAAAACRPYGIDCNSALETAPGVKDPALLRALFNNVRNTTHTEEK